MSSLCTKGKILSSLTPIVFHFLPPDMLLWFFRALSGKLPAMNTAQPTTSLGFHVKSAVFYSTAPIFTIYFGTFR